jgi:hypothetical protein
VTVPFRSPHLGSPRLLFAVCRCRRPAASRRRHLIREPGVVDSAQVRTECGDLEIVKTILDSFGSLNVRAVGAVVPTGSVSPKFLSNLVLKYHFVSY